MSATLKSPAAAKTSTRARAAAENEAAKLRRAGEMLDKIHREAVEVARRAAEIRAQVS